MYGGPSHVDTFDYKPKLYRSRRQDDPRSRPSAAAATRTKAASSGPKWKFQQYGQCGKWVSDLFPHLATCVDDIAFIHSMYAESPIHGSAMLMMNSGRILSGHPCLGSWVNYGLGSVNENLPGFVVMLDKTGGPISGPKNWSSGYMPAAYQGVVIRADGTPIHDLELPPGMTREAQRELLDHLREKNEEHLADRKDNSELSARIASYELAFKMQQHAPEAVDFAKEIAEDAGTVRHRPSSEPRTSAASACWPGGWSSAACASSRSTPAAATTTTTGTPTATWSRTTPSTPATPTSRSPAC